VSRLKVGFCKQNKMNSAVRAPTHTVIMKYYLLHNVLQAPEPVRKLNLREATEVKIDHSKGKQNCIR